MQTTMDYFCARLTITHNFMDWIYLGFVIFLFILAISDLWVGVSNDAVNFLNSAIGAKVARFRTIIIVAATGVFLGAIMSNGMMDIARHGIFRPEQFAFKELMYIFLAVMVTDIILLDVFNSLGMPTSTTVSMVFELLGATFALAIIKMATEETGLGFADYMNTEKALSVIMAIFVSVAIAFVGGIVIQYIARLIFSFDFHKGLTWKIGIYGGIATTAIVYFMLFKGTKDLSFMTSDVKTWIDEHTWMLLGGCLVFFTILMQVLHFLKVNVFKVIVLIGTFALAMAFAGNDLVNFIGVPLAGFSSYQDYMAAGGGDPAGHMMGVLNEPASTPLIFLVAAGVVMVIALATSKKAHNVTKTEINLARQDEGDEMFGSSKAARSIVRWSNSTASFIVSATPDKVKKWIATRFDKTNIDIADNAAYDVVRASVNLVVASLLIALGTSLKLPLSTTYVTFMVAMGTSLADKAWSRESAVFRITGVLSVIGGWFLTAAIAFISAFFIALLMHFGGTVVTVIIVVAGLAVLIHSNVKYKEKNDSTKGDKAYYDILKISDRKQVWVPFLKYVAENDKAFLDEMAAQYTSVTDGLMQENVRTLKRSMNDLKNYKARLKSLRKKETVCLRMADPETALEKSAWFHTSFNYMEQVYYSLRRICEPAYEHVDNNFSPIPAEYCKAFSAVRDELVGTVQSLANHFRERDYEAMRTQEEALSKLQIKFSDLRKALMVDIQEKNLNLTVAYMYLNLVQESEQLCISLKHYARASRKLA